MNILESILAAISPGLAVKREVLGDVRQMQRRLRRSDARMYYDGASRGHRTGGWRPVSTDTNSEIKDAAQRLRDVSRDLIRNNAWARKASDVIVSNTVGKGIIPTAHASSQRLVRSLEDLMIEHFDTPSVDAHGQNTLYGLQALVLATVVQSGECFVRYRQRRLTDGLPLPFQLEVLEPDYLDTQVDGELSNGGFAIQGIEYNALNRVVAYHMFPIHPGDTSRTTTIESRRVPADQVAHIYRVDRPGQARGVSWLAPVIVRLYDLNAYSDASLMRQKIAACFAAFVQSDNVDGIDVTQTTDSGYPLEAFEPGIIERLAPGEQVTFSAPPNVNDAGFRKQALLEIAAGLGISYEAMTGDLSGVNFSSGRMGWLEFQRNIDAWRERMLFPQFLWRVEKWFLQNASIQGLRAGQRDSLKIRWTPPRREMISPKDEITPLADAVRAGFMTRSEVVRKLGYDPLVVDDEFAEEFERADEMELKFDTDVRVATPAAGALPGAAPDAAPAEEEPAEEDEGDEDAGQE